jgi:uncharacterized repeat protein (TIGR02543 family)
VAVLGEPGHRSGASRTVAACAPALLAIPAAGCYAPSVRDCTVTCEAATDCATGQVCGPDGYCAAPGVTGTCARADADATADADAATIDARGDAAIADAHTAPPQPDAAVLGALSVTITGRGDVAVSPLGVTCSAPAKMGATCAYDVVAGAPLLLVAVPTHKDDRFAGWTGACSGTSATCALTATTGTTAVVAGFAGKDH